MNDKSENSIGTAVIQTDEDKPVKKVRNPKGSPLVGANGLIVEPGDNTKFLEINMELFDMKSIDLHDCEALRSRLSDYFALYAKYDMKPTVAGMALALGMNRRTLWAITHDAPLGGRGNYTTLPQASTDLIKKAYFLLENLWETYMNSGKINPMAGVFLGVNNYGYRDVKQVDIAPAAPDNGDDYDVEDIRRRYMIGPSENSGGEPKK